MKTIAYNNEQAFDELKSKWNDLLQRSPANQVFSTWEWISSWWAAYHPGDLLIIACHDESDRLIGLAPLFVDTTTEERIVRVIGCVDVTDYVDVIIDQDCIEPVLGCFAEYLAQHSDAYDRINLCNLPEMSPTYRQFAPILEMQGFSVQFEQQDVCPVIELGTEWSDYTDLLDKKQRHELRRKMRHATGNEGIDWYIVDENHDLSEQLEIFLQLMADSTHEKAEFLENSQHVDFFKRVMPLMHQRGWLQLSLLTVNDEPAASYLNLLYGDRVMVYNSGLSLSHGQLSPGSMLLANNIRWAIDNKYRYFDLLRGNEEYKYRMGGRDTSIYMLKAVREN